jgi:hypothetical protein
MSKVPISKVLEAKSDQLNADDLITGDRVLEITKVTVKDTAEQPIVINYKGDNKKPWKPSKTAGRILTMCWGEDYESWSGSLVKVFRDPDIMYAGKKVGGIMPSHVSGIKKKMICPLTIRRGMKKDYIVLPLTESVKDDKPRDLHKEGADAAMGGMEQYKNWFETLTNDERKTIQSKHEEWKSIAEGGKDDPDGEEQLPQW